MMTCFDLSYLVVGGGARVPDHELLVVGHGAEEGLVQQVPGNILNDGRVAGEDGLGVDHLVLLGRAVDVPEADGVVVGGGEEVAVQVGVPAQAVALLLVAAQAQVGVALKKGQVCCCHRLTEAYISCTERGCLSVTRF